MRVQSDKKPNSFVLLQGKVHFNFNIKEKTIKDENGESHITYEYESVTVPRISRDSLISAMIRNQYSADEETALINNERQGLGKDEYREYILFREEAKKTVDEAIEGIKNDEVLLKKCLATGMISPAEFRSPEDRLNSIKKSKKIEIRLAFEQASTAPVKDSTNSCLWDGGLSSALSIDGAIRLAEQVGLSDVVLYDKNNVEHSLPINEAKEVVALIGKAYQELFAKKQSLLAKVDATSSIDDVNAIVW